MKAYLFLDRELRQGRNSTPRSARTQPNNIPSSGWSPHDRTGETGRKKKNSLEGV